MELEQAISGRYSVRDYSPGPVKRQLIEQILELARMAPSAVNLQPWHFIVITEKGAREALWPVYHREWFRTAPVVIVACLDREASWKRGIDGHDFGEVDLALAIDHLTLAATASGLGSCWICNFNEQLARHILDLPRHLEPLALITLGYPQGNPPLKKRKSLREIVSWEKYTSP